MSNEEGVRVSFVEAASSHQGDTLSVEERREIVSARYPGRHGGDHEMIAEVMYELEHLSLGHGG